MSEVYLPRLLLIGSSGRNSGKTCLACRIIEAFSATVPIIGVKITAVEGGETHSCPRGSTGCGTCSSLKGDFDITREDCPENGKDTSRLLASGCRDVFWVRSQAATLGQAFEALSSDFHPGDFIVCESNSLRKHVVPGVFLVVENSRSEPVKPSCAGVMGLSDMLIPSSGGETDFSPSRLSIEEGGWVLSAAAAASPGTFTSSAADATSATNGVTGSVGTASLPGKRKPESAY